MASLKTLNRSRDGVPFMAPISQSPGWQVGHVAMGAHTRCRVMQQSKLLTLGWNQIRRSRRDTQDRGSTLISGRYFTTQLKLSMIKRCSKRITTLWLRTFDWSAKRVLDSGRVDRCVAIPTWSKARRVHRVECTIFKCLSKPDRAQLSFNKSMDVAIGHSRSVFIRCLCRLLINAGQAVNSVLAETWATGNVLQINDYGTWFWWAFRRSIHSCRSTSFTPQWCERSKDNQVEE